MPDMSGMGVSEKRENFFFSFKQFYFNFYLTDSYAMHYSKHFTHLILITIQGGSSSLDRRELALKFFQ